MYYEMEYDPSPARDGQANAPKAQRLRPPEKDGIREQFEQMREIARKKQFRYFSGSRWNTRQMQENYAEVFYRQGILMQTFEDAYPEAVPCAERIPCYQMMGYKQLRTYFTWRTQVRRGDVQDTSPSYAYLYLYELLNNIGVADPQDGLDRLLFFWRRYREADPSVDAQMYRWLKDYHIYYGPELGQSFAEFAAANGLLEEYPELSGAEDRFSRVCSASKYDIRKSAFFTQDRESLIRDCFDSTVASLTAVFEAHGMDFWQAVFPPVKAMAPWTPFGGALFYPWKQQKDRRVVISAKEIYVCSRNQWSRQTALTQESGRQLTGYILKQMEAALRRLSGYPRKLTAGSGMVNPQTMKRLEDAGISLEECVTAAVEAFYREATRTVVRVNPGALDRIRQEALLTQERLLVPEDGEEEPPVRMEMEAEGKEPDRPVEVQKPEMPEEGPWDALREALTRTEREALLLVLQGAGGFRQFADAHGIMPEILADGINGKAADLMGDSLLDGDFALYEDYVEQVKEMMEV